MSIYYRTLANMRTQVGEFVGDTTTRRGGIIDDWLNTHYADIATQYRWPTLMRGIETTLSFVSGEKFLFLPKDVGQLYFLIRGAPIAESPHQTIENFFRRQLQTVNTAGRVVTYSDIGETGKRASIVTAEKLTIQNIGGGVAEALTVVVHGKVLISGSEFVETREEVALTGTTAVNTTATFSDLIQVSTSGEQTGLISVTGQSSTTLYATIEPGEETARYKMLRLGYTPDTSETYTIYYKRAVSRLTRDNETPELPISHVLIEFAIASQFMLERKWQGAGSQHLEMAQRMLDTIWTEQIAQSNRIEQAVPYVGERRYGYWENCIVVSN